MRHPFFPNGAEKRPLSVLMLGGKPEFDQRALRYEASRENGHILLLANSVKVAWEILLTRPVDRIVIEAFMENSEHETPFHFLESIKNSVYRDIPILIVAAEPSSIGTYLSMVLARAANCFGAEFKLVTQFKPEFVSSMHNVFVESRGCGTACGQDD
jgi:hypothetical protein